MTTVNHPCLARLTNWEYSNYEVSPKKSVTYLSLCKRVALDGKELCETCEKRPRTLKEAQAQAKKSKGLCLDIPDGTLVYRRTSGYEFSAIYREKEGYLELAEKQPLVWPDSLPHIFPTPTLFSKTTAKAALGLEKKVYINGWKICFIRDKEGKQISLQNVRKENKEPIHPHTLLLHGTLTEPPPSISHIYGTPGYISACASLFDEPSERWKKKAAAAEQEAEARCKAAGKVFWKASVPAAPTSKAPEEEDADMPSRKKGSTGTKGGSKAEELPQQKNTILKSFPKITKYYQESADPPKKLPTDTQEIWKEECEGQVYWFSESGWIFSVEDDGEPGEICGKMDTEGNIELYVE